MSSTRKETKSAASSPRGRRSGKKESHIKRYSREELEQLPSETDWPRLDAKSDDEIDAGARADPEWAGLLDLDWSDAQIIRPHRKEAISIRLDDDVLSYFKGLGAGYQTRINAVLRHFMEHARSKQK